MRVLCIDNVGAPGLVEGNVYTATQSIDYEDAYDLEEIPVEPVYNYPVSYRKCRFILLSNENVEISEEIKSNTINN